MVDRLKMHTPDAVFRDSGMKNDSVITRFKQIFETYGPRMVRRVL